MRHDYEAWNTVERKSGKRLPRLLFDYIEGGANEELTVERNRRDLDRIELRQRVMIESCAADTTAAFLGQASAMPLGLSPVGFAGMMARRGEIGALRAAHGNRIPATLSTFSICSLEEVTRRAGSPPMLQLYPLDDPAWTDSFLKQAIDLGVTTLFVTVDVPIPGIRYREARRPLLPGRTFASRAGRIWDGLTHPRWLYDVFVRGRPHSFGNLPHGQPIPLVAPSPAFLSRIRDRWPHRLIIKGILEAADAERALELGADGIVVSNHGGRQLDSVSSTIAALGPILETVAGRCTVLMDGGIRSGLDILKVLASGADGCMIGRGWAHALAAGGEAGVSALLTRLQHELSTAMLLTGRNRIDQIDHTVLAVNRGSGQAPI